MRAYCFILFFLAVHISGKAAQILVLTDEKDEYFLNNSFIKVLEDPNNKWTIKDISTPEIQKQFKTLETQYPENEHPGSAYWVKFTVRNDAKKNQWLFESFNFKISILELYIPDSAGNMVLYKSGADYNFNERNLNHKNFEFVIRNFPKGNQTCYVKFVSREESRVRLLFRSFERFTYYALTEYFILGIFYGMLLIIGLYNLFLYTRIKDIAYFYYAAYVFFAAMFSMVQDGTGFQYLWPESPGWNYHSLFFSSTFMVIFMLLYTKSFLETRLTLPTLNKTINIIIGLRLLVFLIEYFFIPEFINILWVDIIPFLLVYITAIISYRNKNKSALYFVLGFSILFLAFTINTLRIFKMIPSNILTVYILNIGVIIEIFILSLALAERVKKSRENELITEKLNKELEQKVRERTEALVIQKNIIEEKVKTLDTFIYKASHDIKGPLKSLIGLTSLGMKDSNENAPIYFEHALKTAKKLDAIVRDLLNISKINNAPLKPVEIDFNNSLIEILDSLKKLPGYEQMHFSIKIKGEEKFYSEKSLVYSILQNFIENAIKYRDRSKPDSKLKIEIGLEKNYVEIKFIDNGTGIKEEYQGKIFDMFFTVDNQSEDSTGLGLYIVKLAIEKLGGKVKVESKENEGSTFLITLRNNYVKNGI
ncbi:MAG: sensor histidine kinase [Cytophagaceae bacterium]|nr:sensor histidine kinase [Cytophagaceae bacterium]